MIPTFVCPSCQAASLVHTSAKTLSESILGLLRIRPFRCQECGYRCLKFARRRRRQAVGDDRRKHLRIPVRLYLSFSGGRIRGDGHVVDLSLGGCMIKSDAHVKVDDIFYLEIVLPGDTAPVEVAAIVRSVGSRGIAFQFLRKSQDNKRLLTFIQTQTGKPNPSSNSSSNQNPASDQTPSRADAA